MMLKQRLGTWLIPRLPVNRRTFNLVRFELNCMRVRWFGRFSPRTISALRGLRSRSQIKVNLGVGANSQDGCINVDIASHPGVTLAWDIRHSIPFKDNQVAKVFAEHVIEHIEFREDLPRMMSELHRVLEPGGRIRIIVPDARRWLEAYVTDEPGIWQGLGMMELPEDMPTKMAMINHVFHQEGEHLFGYDFETLAIVLRKAGFSNVIRQRYNTSTDPEMCLDTPKHAAYSLYVEAEKECRTNR